MKYKFKIFPVFYRLLTFLLLFNYIISSQAQAMPPSEIKISITAKNVTISDAFTILRKKTGLWFAYSNEQFDDSKKVTLNFDNAPLNDVLKFMLDNTDYSWTITTSAVIIKKLSGQGKKNESLFTTNIPITISGKVTDVNGRPIQGATIQVKGKNKGTNTNAEGNFTLEGIESDAILIISSIGYETKQISTMEGARILIQLKEMVGLLDETQVIAYGTTTKRLSTSNISSVKAEDIARQPINNPLLALQGRVPGLFVAQSTGFSGSGITVRIQGQNSLNKGNDPLYVIDGVPYASQVLPTLTDVLGGSGNTSTSTPSGGGNPLSYINPSDIESIDVLKDADATAIFGSRAANGAIMITTKKGKRGQTKVDINMQSGWGHIARSLNVLNTQQYLQMRREAIKNDNVAVSDADYDINGTWDTTRNINWQKELIGGTSRYTDIQTSASGGNANTQFLVATGYHKETTVFPGDFSDQKGSLHFSINNISPNQKFNLQLSGNYLVDNNQIIGNDLTNNAVRLAPNAPHLYNADGSLNWSPLPSGNSTWQNPLSSLYNKYKVKTKNLIGNSLVSYEIFPGLNIKSSFGYTNLQSNETVIVPLLSTAPEIRPYAQRGAAYGDATISSWLIEPQANYKQDIGKSKLELLVGTTILENSSIQQQIYGTGYNSDLVLEDIKSAPFLSVGTSIASTYKYIALFGRINYNWENKYIVNFAIRRDGSSRFGSQNLFHNFGSIAGAWIFSNEGFIQKWLPFLSFGKFRASYGTTGNDQIGDYQFMNLYAPPFGVVVPYQNSIGLVPGGLPNPYLEWEKTKKINLGLDLGLFTDRLLFNVNYFRNRSSNQLLSYVLPIITGSSNILANLPATVQNSGWEFSLNTTNIKGSVFTWTSSINLTLPQNKLVAFPNLEKASVASSLVIGQPIMILKVYHSLGVDPVTGVYQFADKDGKATSNPNPLTDKTISINTFPKFYGGFQNRFHYKGFELDLLFQFVKQIGPNYLHGFRPGMFYGTSNIGNQPTTVLQRWQKPGDITNIQRYSSNFSAFFPFFNATNSDAAYSDASYIRLKNLSFSWQLPDDWKQKVHLKNCRLYVQGQNLFTLTNYIGMDPETKSSTTLPPLRVLTLGFQITL